MLDVNIQPVALEMSKMQVQDTKVQGQNFDQDESSFSAMLEKEQAKSTEGNQNTTKLDSQNNDSNSKTAEKVDTENGFIDNSNEVEMIPSIFVDTNIQSQQIETKITLSQIDYLQTTPVEFNENLLALETPALEDEFYNLSEINALLKDDNSNVEFDKKLDFLTKKNPLNTEISQNGSNGEVESETNKKDELVDENLVQANVENGISVMQNDSIVAQEFENQIELQNQVEPLETKIEDKINIIDERTTAAVQATEKANVSKESAKTGNYVKTVEYDKSGNATVSLNIGQNLNQFVEADGVPKTNDFSSLLSREIQNSTKEIVQSGSMILKDNNAGTINLILKPESLGTVKIKLEISDNQITGKILVASKEAYDAFNQNLNVLKNAFIDSGFNAGGFDLAFTGSGMNGNFNGENSQHAASFSDEINSKGKIYEDALPEVIPESYITKDSINLVA